MRVFLLTSGGDLKDFSRRDFPALDLGLCSNASIPADKWWRLEKIFQGEVFQRWILGSAQMRVFLLTSDGDLKRFFKASGSGGPCLAHSPKWK